MPRSERSSDPGVDRLMRQLSRGDTKAFASLYDAVAPSVFGLARRVTRDSAIAEEVTQEVMLEVWRTAKRFDASRGTARTYIMTLAHRRSVDRVRSEEASRRRTEAVGHKDMDRPYDSVYEHVERDFDRSKVRKALGGLSQLQREAILLAYWEGLTQTEIATHLSIPVGTVKTRIRDAMLRLGTALGDTT